MVSSVSDMTSWSWGSAFPLRDAAGRLDGHTKDTYKDPATADTTLITDKLRCLWDLSSMNLKVPRALERA